MANAYFLNAMPVSISLNLNVEQQNHLLDPYSVSTSSQNQRVESVNASGESIFTWASWKTAYQAYPNTSVLGNGGASNVLVVFPSGSNRFLAYEIVSKVNTTLDVYIFVLGDTLVGTDQTGSTTGITISPASEKLIQQTLRLIPTPVS